MKNSTVCIAIAAVVVIAAVVTNSAKDVPPRAESKEATAMLTQPPTGTESELLELLKRRLRARPQMDPSNNRLTLALYHIR